MTSSSRSVAPAAPVSSATVLVGAMVTVACVGSTPASFRTLDMGSSAAGGPVISRLPSSTSKSSAPASMAASASSSACASVSDSTVTMARLSKIQATDPASPRLPPPREKAARTSAAVRLRLSVSALSMMAAPPGP